jgi:threonine aldolase
MIDLRSDTVTKPTPQMMEAMMKAKVGDDVFGEDPTVKELQQKLADMFGMQEGLFCPSGTMCNQIAMKAHTEPMDEIICDKLSHVYYYETGGYAFNSGCSIRLIDGDRGRISASQIIENIQPDYDWLPVSKLVVIENSCNKGGGATYSLEELESVSNICKEKNLKLHMDGARLFNALLHRNLNACDLHGLFDSISICLSKGLGAPIGSVLLGDSKFIKKSRKIRKAFGGGMRQVGYLAAAGIYALDHHVERLKDDHVNAVKLQKCLSELSYVSEIYPVETNIVIFDLDESESVADFLQYLKNNQVLAIQFGPKTVRMVTHLDVSNKMIDDVIEVLKSYI